MISASISLALRSTDLVETVGAIRKVAMEVVIMRGVVFRGQDNIEDPVEMELLDKPLIKLLKRITIRLFENAGYKLQMAEIFNAPEPATSEQ